MTDTNGRTFFASHYDAGRTVLEAELDEKLPYAAKLVAHFLLIHWVRAVPEASLTAPLYRICRLDWLIRLHVYCTCIAANFCFRDFFIFYKLIYNAASIILNDEMLMGTFLMIELRTQFVNYHGRRVRM